MSCGCEGSKTVGSDAEKRVCDVCELVDGDISIKLVYRCDFCDSWICFECKNKYHKRALAAIKKKLKRN
jgi:hypothetical protein